MKCEYMRIGIGRFRTDAGFIFFLCKEKRRRRKAFEVFRFECFSNRISMMNNSLWKLIKIIEKACFHEMITIEEIFELKGACGFDLNPRLIHKDKDRTSDSVVIMYFYQLNRREWSYRRIIHQYLLYSPDVEKKIGYKYLDRSHFPFTSFVFV